METSKTIYQKFLKVQEEVGAIKKTEKNPFFNSKYFDVNGILAALKPVLTKNGLVLIQPLRYEGNNLLLETRLIDSFDGQEISATTILPALIDSQKQGSAITYFRRYALQSFFALEAEDDDANTASQPVNRNATVSTHSEQYNPKKKPLDRSVGEDNVIEY